MGKAIVVPDVVFSGVNNIIKVSCPTWAYNGYELTSYAMNHTFHQGVAIYGNYAMHFDHNGEYFYVYNISTKQQLASIRVQEPDTNRHGNTANFGTKKYDENDDFPLLYVSGSESRTDGTDDIIKTIDVYRVQLNNSTWTCTRVQVIDFSETPVTYTNACFHGDNLVLLQNKAYEYECPSVTPIEQGEVDVYTLTDNDFVAEHPSPSLNIFDLVQGCTCVGDYVYYINSTYNGTNFRHYLDISSLDTDEIVGHYFINEAKEIQQIAYWAAQKRFMLFYREGNYSKYIDFVRNT